MLRITLLCLFVTSVLGGMTPRSSLRTRKGRIMGGTEADPGEYPSMLSFQVKKVHNCGASILNAKWALTAAHCLEGNAVSDIQLLAGTNDLTVGGSRHQASRIIIHKNYNATNSYVNDIAVIEVVESFVMSDLVKPIKLPQQDQTTEAGVSAIIIGWGSLSLEGAFPNKLQEVTIPIHDHDYCKSRYNEISKNIYSTQICAGDPQGNVGTCNDDSGGSLFVDGTVVGLASMGSGCRTPDFPTVYTRVASYRDWITQNTGV